MRFKGKKLVAVAGGRNIDLEVLKRIICWGGRCMPRCCPAVCALVWLVTSVGGADAAGAGSGSPPNLVLLLTDDQAWDAFGLREPLVSTPHMDLLAQEGVLFDNAFVSTSICPASRASILTGVHFPTHQHTFDHPPLSAEELADSWPVLLRQLGYETGFLGKNGLRLQESELDLLFDDWEVFPRDYFVKVGGEEVHLTDLLADRAREYIENQTSAKPFALLVWFHAPHAVNGQTAQPFVPPRRYESLYDDVTFPRRPGSDPELWDGRPDFLDLGLNEEQGSLWWSDELYQENSRRYHGMLRGIDDAVGTVRDALAATGAAADTVIVFLSDNGFYRGERLFGGKWLGHDVSSRVPMIINAPGIAPRVVSEMVTNVDLAQTILELSGVERPASMQGLSLVPLLAGEPVPWRQDFFIEHSFVPRNRPEIPRFYGIRSEHWKYMRYRDHNYEQLFDLLQDPDEIVNLALDPQHAQTRDLLRARAEELLFEYGGIFQDGFESGSTAAWSTTVP